MWQSCCWRRSCWTICWHPRGMVAEGLAAGLSPRVRGNPTPPRKPPSRPGSIPACAGEPEIRAKSVYSARVYPRVCGGTLSWRRRPAAAAGLSPRVRGNQHFADPGIEPRGSIPACAGEPLAALMRSASAWVYPRVCGGTICSDSVSRRARGLSPRVRGNHDLAHDALDLDGSIPACAGEPGRPSKRS